MQRQGIWRMEVSMATHPRRNKSSSHTKRGAVAKAYIARFKQVNKVSKCPQSMWSTQRGEPWQKPTLPRFKQEDECTKHVEQKCRLKSSTTTSTTLALSSILRHFQASSGIFKHPQALPSILRHFQASSGTFKHTQAVWNRAGRTRAASSVFKHIQILLSILRHSGIGQKGPGRVSSVIKHSRAIPSILESGRRGWGRS
eukprot:1161341-Pelagomonas_calceolata.AAC.3